MLSMFKNLFRSNLEAIQAVAAGARVIDVRSPEEFRSGHVKGSFNVPLGKLPSGLKGAEKDDTIVVCCQSGGRSARAASILRSSGYQKVIDAGSWLNLK
jgi:phage shock protein E